ncbi:MAG: ABC transporter permease [Oscillospiraceae bacterium]|nr:ABC transporter permease [Oscillospiraceae bacterium]
MSDAVKTVEVKKKFKRESEMSYWGSVFFRLKKNKMAMVSLIVLVIIVLGCIFVPIFSELDYIHTNTDNNNQPPSWEHPFGTDQIGRDLFVRFFNGGRISLGLALSVVILEVVIGTIMGCIAGYYGKFADTIIMRFCEILMSFPFLMFAITMVALFGNSIPVLIFVMVLLTWPSVCRIVRGQILTLRELEYMEACEALGLSDWRRIFKHLLPNILAYAIVFATLGMASVILTETALSFLGLGVSPPTPTWGNLIQEARNFTILTQRWWYWIPPGLGIFVSVMCFNILGDGLRDAIDPKMKR